MFSGLLAVSAAALAMLADSPATQGPAAAPTPAAPAAAAAPKSPSDPDQKVVCHKYTATGSLLDTQKVCHTVADWRQIAQDARTDIENSTRQGLSLQSQTNASGH